MKPHRWLIAAPALIALMLLLTMQPSHAESDFKKISGSLADLSQSVTNLRTEIIGLRTDVRADRSLMIERTNGFNQKLADMSNRVDDLDVAKSAARSLKNGARITALEQAAAEASQERKVQAEQAKLDHDALMAWVRPGFLAIFGVLVSLGVQGILTRVHRIQMAKNFSLATAASEKTDANIEEVQKTVNGRLEKLLRAAHQEGLDAGRTERQGEEALALKIETAEIAVKLAESTREIATELASGAAIKGSSHPG